MNPRPPLVLHGDCLDHLAQLDPDSVHAVVTDPPYGLGFLDKEWDQLPPGREWAEACYRVLKPGGHLLAFGGTRTWHRLATAIVDGGFDLRDSIAWIYTSGFPKSHDISKAIDRAAGADRPVIGQATNGVRSLDALNLLHGKRPQLYRQTTTYNVTAPATPDATTWQGWGTALKPAFEPILVARKPFAGTVADNVLQHGTGALNIDGCRIPSPGEPSRWPANVILDDPPGPPGHPAERDRSRPVRGQRNHARSCPSRRIQRDRYRTRSRVPAADRTTASPTDPGRSRPLPLDGR